MERIESRKNFKLFSGFSKYLGPRKKLPVVDAVDLSIYRGFFIQITYALFVES